MIETVDDIKTIANVGTGTMGHAITLQFALAGYPVHLVGRGEASLEKAMKAIRSDAEDFAEAGLLKDGDTLDAVLARITGYADYASGVADVDFVIESVAENLDIKKSVWAEVVSEVNSESRKQEGDDPYCQGFQRNGRFDAG